MATVVLLTRDLRVRDNPALHTAAATAETVVPLFVVDPAVTASANRRRFLAESLADLRTSLRHRGGDLVVRYGDPVAETMRLARSVGAGAIHVSADASGYAARRERRLAEAAATDRVALAHHEAVGVVAPGAVTPTTGGTHYKVFTPYWRAWRAHPRRPELPAPGRVRLPDGVTPGDLPPVGPATSPDGAPGGETAGRRRLARWQPQAPGYPDHHDDLAADATSRLSPYLHFGNLSALTVAAATGVEAFVRQLCWRDFYQQVLAAFPALARRAYRAGAAEDWADDPDRRAAWREGRTGVPIVDAGLRQLAAQGYLPGRARLITASFLVKKLDLDWRTGVDHFAGLLLDADVANNAGNWQWVAGTGTDTKPYRQFNPLRQAARFDPDGAYVRRWIPELSGVDGPAVHRPWLLPAGRRPKGYPEPLPGTIEREG